MRSESLRGHLDLLLLEVLGRSPGHGYAVISALRASSAGVLDLTEGAVYPALHRLEERGLLAGDWQEVSGRRRKVYALTSAGREALLDQRRDWRLLTSAVEAVLTRPDQRPEPRWAGA